MAGVRARARARQRVRKLGERLETGVDAVATAAADLVWPQRCVVCDAPGANLCDACAQKITWIDQRFCCPSCGAPAGWLCCTECDGAWEAQGSISATVFEGVVARAVRAYKDEGERALAEDLAAILAHGLFLREDASLAGAAAVAAEALGTTGDAGTTAGVTPQEASDATQAAAATRPATRAATGGEDSLVDTGASCAPFAVGALDGMVFVPATHEAYLRRGFDHMEYVARELAAITGLEVFDALARTSARDQRELGREARAANAARTYAVAQEVYGARILLIDDVITTGASMREAVRSLQAAGAEQVWAASIARVRS